MNRVICDKLCRLSNTVDFQITDRNCLIKYQGLSASMQKVLPTLALAKEISKHKHTKGVCTVDPLQIN